jgi:hypothetical protein
MTVNQGMKFVRKTGYEEEIMETHVYGRITLE